MLPALAKAFPGVLKKAALQEAHFIRGKIVEGIASQAPGGKPFKPLSPLTLAARRLAGFRGTKALIRTGDLRNSIVVVVGKDGSVAIGVSRNAKGEDGQDLVKVAEIMEFGAGPYVIQLTPKMVAWIAKLYEEAGIERAPSARGGGKGYIVVKIPARPFMRPVFEKWGKPTDVRARLQARIAKLLKPYGGR